MLPHCPPLGKDLYDELRQSFPETWGNFPPELASRFKRDFETGMDALWRRDSQEQSQPLAEIGRYFARFRPDPSEPSCYMRLIRLLASFNLIDACGFATLNYDCLLDLDLHSANIGYHDGARRGPFKHTRSVPLWKLHGASNALPGIGTNTFTGTRFHGISGEIFSGPVRYVTPGEAIANYDNDGLPPMLSLYAPWKANLCCKGGHRNNSS